MDHNPRFFTYFYDADRTGRIIVTDVLEVTSRDTAVYTAKIGAMRHAGAAAVSVSDHEPDRADVLRHYGTMPRPAS